MPLYLFVVLATSVVGWIPSRIGNALAWLLGSVIYFLLPNRRRVMRANYAPVLGRPDGDPQVRRMGRLSFRNFFRYLYAFLSLPRRSIEDIDSHVGLHVGDDFIQARAEGKGMVFVSAHFGNMDWAGIAVCRRIVQMTVVADMLKPQRLMDYLVSFRGKKGLRVVYGARAPRAILNALKNNEAVGFLLDVGCKRAGGIPVMFFGRRTTFPSGPALLSLRTGAPIVVGYALVVGDRVEAYSYPPIYATNTGNKEEDVRRCSQMIARHFEDFIGRYPEQWYIFRPMWETESAPAPAAATIEEPQLTTLAEAGETWRSITSAPGAHQPLSSDVMNDA
jgi:KDO2-lipid IV(A) lauroyltransferase